MFERLVNRHCSILVVVIFLFLLHFICTVVPFNMPVTLNEADQFPNQVDTPTDEVDGDSESIGYTHFCRLTCAIIVQYSYL